MSGGKGSRTRVESDGRKGRREGSFLSFGMKTMAKKLNGGYGRGLTRELTSNRLVQVQKRRSLEK